MNNNKRQKERPIKLTFRITRKEIEELLFGRENSQPLSNYHYRAIRKLIKSFDGVNEILYGDFGGFFHYLTEDETDGGYRVLKPKEILDWLER